LRNTQKHYEEAMNIMKKSCYDNGGKVFVEETEFHGQRSLYTGLLAMVSRAQAETPQIDVLAPYHILSGLI